jgi:hypothetical protein
LLGCIREADFVTRLDMTHLVVLLLPSAIGRRANVR